MVVNETLCHSGNLLTPQQPAGVLAPDLPEPRRRRQVFESWGRRHGHQSGLFSERAVRAAGWSQARPLCPRSPAAGACAQGVGQGAHASDAAPGGRTGHVDSDVPLERTRMHSSRSSVCGQADGGRGRGGSHWQPEKKGAGGGGRGCGPPSAASCERHCAPFSPAVPSALCGRQSSDAVVDVVGLRHVGAAVPSGCVSVICFCTCVFP